MEREPSVIVGGIASFIAAAIVLMQSFGVDISDGQSSALIRMTAVLAPIIAAFVIRGYVVSPHTAKEKVAEATSNAVAGAPPPSVKV